MDNIRIEHIVRACADNTQTTAHVTKLVHQFKNSRRRASSIIEPFIKEFYPNEETITSIDAWTIDSPNTKRVLWFPEMQQGIRVDAFPTTLPTGLRSEHLNLKIARGEFWYPERYEVSDKILLVYSDSYDMNMLRYDVNFNVGNYPESKVTFHDYHVDIVITTHTKEYM